MLLTIVSLVAAVIAAVGFHYLARVPTGPRSRREASESTPRSLITDDVEIESEDSTAAQPSSERPPVRSRSGDRPNHRASQRDVVHSDAQVLFAEVHAGTLWVDCAFVGREAEGVSPGALLTLRLVTPGVLGLDAPIEAVVQRWAAEAAVVDLRLRTLRNGWRVVLDDGETKVNLEVYDAVGAS